MPLSEANYEIDDGMGIGLAGVCCTFPNNKVNDERYEKKPAENRESTIKNREPRTERVERSYL